MSCSASSSTVSGSRCRFRSLRERLATTPPRWSSTTRWSSSRRWPRVYATSTPATRRVSCGRTTSRRARCCGGGTRCPARGSRATKRGRATHGTTPAIPASGRRCRPTRRPGSSTCRLNRPRSTSTAATAWATICTTRAWLRST